MARNLRRQENEQIDSPLVELVVHNLQPQSENMTYSLVYTGLNTAFSLALSSFLLELAKQSLVTKNGFSVSSIFMTNLAGK